MSNTERGLRYIETPLHQRSGKFQAEVALGEAVEKAVSAGLNAREIVREVRKKISYLDPKKVAERERDLARRRPEEELARILNTYSDESLWNGPVGLE